MRGIRRRFAAALVAVLAAVWVGPGRTASAHQGGLAYLELTVDGPVVRTLLDVPSADLDAVLPLDADRDGILTTKDMEAVRAALGAWLVSGVNVFAGGKRCAGEPAGVLLREDRLVTLEAVYTCPEDVRSLGVALSPNLLGEGHSTFVRAVHGERSAQSLLGGRTFTANFDLERASALAAAGRFLLLGVEHIFTGFDHVLFLLALLMLGGTLRRVVGMVTAFTAAHSITLSLAALGLVSLPSRLVESAIALSIAYVAVENYVFAKTALPGTPEPRSLRLRWVLTFAFGLIHGFGFAGVLTELGLPQDHLAVALGTFNLGVELGQVAIVAVAYPLLTRALRTRWYRPRGVQVASLGVFAMAVYWLVERLFE